LGVFPQVHVAVDHRDGAITEYDTQTRTIVGKRNIDGTEVFCWHKTLKIDVCYYSSITACKIDKIYCRNKENGPKEWLK